MHWQYWISEVKEIPGPGEDDFVYEHSVRCPVCGWNMKIRIEDFDYNFCPKCGQHLHKKEEE